MPSQIEVLPEEAELFSTAADLFVDIVRKAIADHGLAHVALSGGGTPRGLYQRLTAADCRDTVDWKQLRFYFSDERTVPPDHPDSNFGLARQHLFEPLGVPMAHVSRLRGELPPQQAADLAEQELAAAYQTSREAPPPSLDLVLLGLGSDAHTASLFPDTRGLAESKRWFIANEVPRLQTWRLTMTPRLINAAHHVMFLVTGSDKAAALARVLQGPSEPRSFPAQLIAPSFGKLHWLVDRSAAADLDPHQLRQT